MWTSFLSGRVNIQMYEDETECTFQRIQHLSIPVKVWVVLRSMEGGGVSNFQNSRPAPASQRMGNLQQRTANQIRRLRVRNEMTHSWLILLQFEQYFVNYVRKSQWCLFFIAGGVCVITTLQNVRSCGNLLPITWSISSRQLGWNASTNFLPRVQGRLKKKKTQWNPP